MGSTLPVLSRGVFGDELGRLALDLGISLGPSSFEALWIHYSELIKWNPRLSLVGPGTGSKILQRHYGEALAALPYLVGDESILDVGSGGGFPGFVLAASCPGTSVTLVEPNGRKWSFLSTVIRKVKAAQIPLSCRALDARVEDPLPVSPALPEKIDIVTCRALTLGPPRLRVLVEKYPDVRFLLWSSDPREWTAQDPKAQEVGDGSKTHGVETQSFPQGNDPLDGLDSYRIVGRIPLQGSRQRLIIDAKPAP